MQLLKPIKKIEYYFENGISEKLEQALLSFITTDVPNEEVKIGFSDDREIMYIEAEDIDELIKLRDLSKTFLLKKKIKCGELFKTSVVIEFLEEEAFTFLGTFFSKPFDGADYLCVETRFVCREEDAVFFISMEVESEKQILVEASDTVENDETIKLKYEKAMTMIHKIVKY